MIRLFAMAVALLLALPVLAAPGDVRRFPAHAAATAQLRIHGTTDIEVFAVVIADYQRLHPGTEVVYEDIITQDLYARYLHDRAGPASPDLLISSGMDLQTRLVNDGHALPHRSAQTAALPGWAQWRNEAFGISYEPVVMVYNTRAMPAAKVPHTRRQLLDRLRAEGAPLRGKVGTYDIERSSVGYLLATQDAQRGSIAGALLGARSPPATTPGGARSARKAARCNASCSCTARACNSASTASAPCRRYWRWIRICCTRCACHPRPPNGSA